MTDVTLTQVALFLAAAVVAAPLAKILRIGNVLGYLLVGVMIGPFGVGFVYSVYEVSSVLHFAEFGVVLLLFLIGLELRPKRLWAMRAAIFGARRRPGRPSPALAAGRHRHGLRPGLAGRALRRPGAVAVVDGLRPAGAGGEGRAGAAPRPHGVRHPAVPGPGGHPAVGLTPLLAHRARRGGPMKPDRALGHRPHSAGGRGRPLLLAACSASSPARACRRR